MVKYWQNTQGSKVFYRRYGGLRVERISILAITKNGIKIAVKIKEVYPSWNIFAPEKFSNGNSSITWFSESTSSKIEEIFKTISLMGY